MGKSAWTPKPKSLSEKGYRKYMARQTKVTVNGQEFTLQSVSPTWYLQNSDKHNMVSGRRDTAGYLDSLIRNCVISPPEVSAGGLKYFDEQEDISTPMALLGEIESFLKG